MGLPGAKSSKQWLMAKQCVCFSASMAKPIIFWNVNPATGMLLILQCYNKNPEVTKQWCSSNPWSQQTRANSPVCPSCSVWSRVRGKWEESPQGPPDSDCLSVKIKQNDRKQLTYTHFSLYTAPENVKCHHLREGIFVCDLMRICVFTCT